MKQKKYDEWGRRVGERRRRKKREDYLYPLIKRYEGRG